MLKEEKEEVALAFWLAAGSTADKLRTSTNATGVVLMGGYSEAEILFSLDFYCIFSPFWTCILKSGTVREDKLSEGLKMDV